MTSTIEHDTLKGCAPTNFRLCRCVSDAQAASSRKEATQYLGTVDIVEGGHGSDMAAVIGGVWNEGAPGSDQP